MLSWHQSHWTSRRNACREGERRYKLPQELKHYLGVICQRLLYLETNDTKVVFYLGKTCRPTRLHNVERRCTLETTTSNAQVAHTRLTDEALGCGQMHSWRTSSEMHQKHVCKGRAWCALCWRTGGAPGGSGLWTMHSWRTSFRNAGQAPGFPGSGSP